jgi:autotransporter adhesin
MQRKENIMKNKMYALLLAALLFSLLAGCGSQGTTLTGADRDAVLAYSEAKTDNLLAGMNANDYAMFSKDFDQDMLNAMTQSQFDALKLDRDAKLGLYVSRQVNSVVQDGDFYAVIYDAKFEKQAAVTVRVVFRISEPHQVSGLWFNK